MALLNRNLLIDQGATYHDLLRWTEGGTPKDLTGYTAHMQIRQTPESGAVLADLTTQNSLIVLNAALGTVALTIPATTTAGMPAGQCVYDLALHAPNGDVVRFMQGSASVTPAVTR